MMSVSWDLKFKTYKMKRRNFVKISALGTAGAIISNSKIQAQPILDKAKNNNFLNTKPKVVSTWNHGMEANKAAWEVLKTNGNSLDAVEKGVRVTESDPNNRSVGLGGLPDKNGIVTLDACIMDHQFNCGAVSFLQNIENPISVARKVMEDTPHVMLSGKGAYDFAIEKGFNHTKLLTKDSKEAWLKWKQKNKTQKPEVNIENHDTIGMLAIDHNGDLSGACTTSGLAYKLHGRVGDSPIIGAGLYVDNEIGAACATGVGEAVIRTCGTHAIVELMRNGKSPQEACEIVINRIKKAHKDISGLQVGFIALNKNGEEGAHCIYKGFNYALRDEKNEIMVVSSYEIDW